MTVDSQDCRDFIGEKFQRTWYVQRRYILVEETSVGLQFFACPCPWGQNGSNVERHTIIQLILCCICLTFKKHPSLQLCGVTAENLSNLNDRVDFVHKERGLLYQPAPVSNGSDSQCLWALKSVLALFDTEVSAFAYSTRRTT